MSSNRLFRGFKNQGMNYRIRILFFIYFVLTSLNCMARSSTFETTELTIETMDGHLVTISAEMARTKEEQSQGLMKRKRLPDGKGMIFIFEKDQILSFWMKDTLIPLSIAFISGDGKILEIYDMEPLNLTPIHSSRSARFALEVPQSWFSRAGISVGDSILGSEGLLRRK
jgi:uncharacterized membrane protein (UPF0127 family)